MVAAWYNINPYTLGRQAGRQAGMQTDRQIERMYIRGEPVGLLYLILHYVNPLLTLLSIQVDSRD